MAEYPLTSKIPYEMLRRLSKNEWASIGLDALMQLLGEDNASNEALQAEVARRHDVLHLNKLVPYKLPARFPRAVTGESTVL